MSLNVCILIHSALISTSIYGLTGKIAFDEDGFMNISKFRVRNLVSDGRQAVWQDIGCVQGKEIRPFRIIWPGDAQNLKVWKFSFKIIGRDDMDGLFDLSRRM